MRHDNALGGSGTAGGEDDVGGRVGRHGRRERTGPGGGLQLVDIDDVGCTVPRAVACVGDDQPRVADRHHPFLASGRLVVVDRDVDRPSGQDGEHGGHLPDALAQDDGNPISFPDA